MATNIPYGGINYGVQVTNNYGTITVSSGQTEALDRQCLRDLRATDPYHDKERIKETNGGLLEDSYRWILDNIAFREWQVSQTNRVLWIRGDPGKGKTILLCGIIEEMTRTNGNGPQENSVTLSYFFCQATDNRINSATSVLRGLIFLLVKDNWSLLRHVRARYDSAGKDLFEDINAWSALVSILTEILEDSALKGVYLVIDALDECLEGREEMIDLIIEKSSTHQKVRWIISSRNGLDIVERLDPTAWVAPISLELNETHVSEAVNIFIRYKVGLLRTKKKYTPETSDEVYRHLFSNSQGTFLWVALVCKNLDQTPRWHVKKKLEMFPPGLDALSRRMMGLIRKSEDVDLCKQILGTVSTVFRPVTLSELASLLEGRNDVFDDSDELDLDTISAIIATCGSFLTVRESTVLFVHQSAKDFLLRETAPEILPGGAKNEHHTIFSQSLEIVFKTLRRNIFDVKHPGTSIQEIRKPNPNPLAKAAYVCIHWVDHLQASEHTMTPELNQEDGSRINVFLKQSYLHWLEALCLLERISDGINAIQKLGSLIEGQSNHEGLSRQAQDAYKFVRYHRNGIESSPLQVYYSSLIFSPSKSLTRMAFQKERANWVLNHPMIEEDWSHCVQTLEGHSKTVRSVAWSPDGSRLASASEDETVRIWDSVTGQHASTFKGHSDWVKWIAWSPDGSRLASMSDDRTVRVWDPSTGQTVSTLKRADDGFFEFISWSSDGTHILSGSNHKTVCVWNPATGQHLYTLKGEIYRHEADRVSPRLLHTNLGTLDTSLMGPGIFETDSLMLPISHSGFGMDEDHNWITHNGVNLLWLPSEYRPHGRGCFDIRASVIAIAVASNRVIFLELSDQCSK